MRYDAPIRKTEKHRAILRFIDEYRREYKQAPSTEIIGAHFHITRNLAYYYVNRLMALGYLRVDRVFVVSRFKTARLTAAGRRMIAEDNS